MLRPTDAAAAADAVDASADDVGEDVAAAVAVDWDAVESVSCQGNQHASPLLVAPADDDESVQPVRMQQQQPRQQQPPPPQP